MRQWFPGPIALKSDSDAWLKESLEEYLVWRHLLEKDPEAARRMVTEAMRDAIAHEPLRPLALGLRLLSAEPPQIARATLYSRGMLVWRTLETVIDRERVDRALREYSARHGGGSAGISDFRQICEQLSGRELGWFFEYYIRGTQLPQIELRRLPSQAPNEVAGEIVVRNVPPKFQVRVEMNLMTAAGRTIRHSVATRGQVTPFTVSMAEAVTRITLDPDWRILRETRPADSAPGNH